MNRMYFTASLILLLVFSFFYLTGCSDDSGSSSGQDQNDDDDNDDNDNDDDDNGLDAISTATPGLRDQILTPSHSAWQKDDCRGCHQDPHQAGYTNPVCASCHGNNGAPQRAVGHTAEDNCVSCHADSHASGGYAAPQDCTFCHKFASSTECPATTDVDVVIIGSGGGGLGAAARLAKAGGLKVAVLEKHHRTGGYMTRFTRGDHKFEVSLHGFDGLDEATNGMNVSAFKQLDIWDRVTKIRPDPFMRNYYPGLVIDTPADTTAYFATLKEMYPAEADNLDRLYAEMVKVDEVFKAIISIQREGATPEAIQTLMSNLDVALRIAQYIDMTLSEFLAGYLHDPKLLTIWTALSAFAGASPDDVSALFFMIMWNSYYLSGYYYFEGGSEAVSDALTAVFLENSGILRLNTLATKIDVADGKAVRVHTQNDLCYNTRYVIANNNVPDLVHQLIGAENLPADYVARIDSLEVGLSAVQIFLGLDTNFDSYFKGAHDLAVATTWDQEEAFGYAMDGVPEKTGLAIINYSMIDPTAAPPDKSTIEITTQLPYDWEQCWMLDNGYESYDEFKQDLAELYIARAEEYLPGLSQHIEVLEVGSPQTMKGYTFNPKGTIFGWNTTPEQSMMNRLEQETPLTNLYLAGAWTFPGGGQSAVIQSGVAAADLILKAEGKK